MKHKNDPRQNGLFDPERQNFSPVGYDRLDQGWQGIFRRSLLAVRRTAEKTEAWQQRHRRRAGIEGTNSGLKRRMGLGKLRVRGKKSVFNVVLLKVTGWNIFRAADAIARTAKRAIQTQITSSGGLVWPRFVAFASRALGREPLTWLRRGWRIESSGLLAA